MMTDELIQENIETLIKTLDHFLESEEYFRKVAKAFRKMLDSLQNEGFTREEAVLLMSRLKLY